MKYELRYRIRGAGAIGRLGAALLAVAFAAGCQSKPDGQRAKAADKSLEEIQKSGQQLKDATDELLKRRGQLARERDDLRAKRKALEEKKAALAQDDLAGKENLAKEETDLKEKEKSLRSQEDQVNEKLLGAIQRQEQLYAKASAALAGRGGDQTAGVRGREHAVAIREAQVAQRERDLSAREKALAEEYRKVVAYKAEKCAVAAPVFTTIQAPSLPATASGSYTEADARNAYAKIQGLMSSKGISMSDLPAGFASLISDINQAIGAKEYARAKVAADQVYAALKSLKVDRGFVGAKMARLAAVIRAKKLSDATREQVNKLFVEVTTAYNDGRFDAANRTINRIYGLLK